MMTCHRSCGSALTADYRLFCTCPILFFYARPQILRMLPYFRNGYHMGSFYLQTHPPPVSTTVNERIAARGGLIRLIHAVSFFFSFLKLYLP